MAIFLDGMSCPLCGVAIQGGDAKEMFPPLFGNRKDPLYVFNDATVHKHCVDKHPLRDQVMSLLAAYLEMKKPGEKRCFFTGEPIPDRKDLFWLGHLASDPEHPLYSYNCAVLSFKTIGHWSGLPNLIRLLEEYQDSGGWQGPGLPCLIEELKKRVPKDG